MKRWGPPLLLVVLVAGFAWWLLQDPVHTRGKTLDRGATPTAADEEGVRLEGTADDATEGSDPARTIPDGDAPPSWRFVGRVCRSGRHPASGVRVELRSAGVRRASTVTGEDGRFRLPPGDLPDDAWTSFVVWAEDEDGASDFVNRGSFAKRTRDLDVGTLVLQRGYALEVVVEGDAGPLAGAQVDLFGGGQVRQGHALTATTDGTGRARFEGIPAEEFHVVAWAEGYASKARPVGLPRVAKGPLRLRLERGRDVTVEVVALPDATPVEGVQVRVLDRRGGARHSYTQGLHPPLDVPPTDERGQTRIPNLGREPHYHLGVEARGYATLGWVPGRTTWSPRLRELVPIPPDADLVRVELPPTRRVTWPVVAGEERVPPDGTIVRFLLPHHPTTQVTPGVDGGRIEDGHLVVEGLIDRPFSGVAVTSDGLLTRATIDATSTEGAPVTFTRPRALEVALRYEDGTPADGLSVSLRDAEDRALGPHEKTDAEGHARIESLLPEAGSVWVHPPGENVAHADLTAGDVRLELTVPRNEHRSLPVLVRVLLGGRPGLPDDYRLHTGWDESWMEVLAEDPSTGTLSCRWRPGAGKDEGEVRLTSPDHVGVVRRVDLETKELVFDLESAGRMLLRVLHDGDYRVRSRLERWDAEDRAWVAAESTSRTWRTLEPPLAGDSWFYRGLAPGRYRVTSQPSGAVSEEVMVEASGEPVVLTLDATSPGTVQGLVVGPEGADLASAYVEVRRLRGDEGPREVVLDEEHRFEIPWTYGHEQIELTARHPLLRPHPERGSVRLQGAGAAVRLELAYGPLATVLVELDDTIETPSEPPSSTWILLLRKARDRTPALRLRAAVDVEGERRWRLTFGGYEPGTWTIWSDLGGETTAPLVLRNVDLDALDPDLGVVCLVRGSTVRLDLKATRPLGPGFGVLQVDTLFGPEHGRQAIRVGTGLLEVTGLGPGRYRLTGGWMGVDDAQTPTDLDEEIELDGRSTIEREITK